MKTFRTLSVAVAALVSGLSVAAFAQSGDGNSATGSGSSTVPGSLPESPTNFSNLRGGAPARALDQSIREINQNIQNSGSPVEQSNTAPVPGTIDVHANGASDQSGQLLHSDGQPLPSDNQILHSEYVPINPPVQKGLTPRKGTSTNKAPYKTGLSPRYSKRPVPNAAEMETRRQLESIADQATKSSGAIFQDPENVIVKPPLLTALITLEKHRSPFQLDADSSSAVTLRDVLQTGLESNLDIKIAEQDVIARKWAQVGAFSGFLPNIGNEFNFEGLGGTYVTPAGFAIPIHNGFMTANSSFNWTLYKGGGILHNYLQNKHQYRATQAAAKGTVNDVLDDVTRNYYSLVLNQVLLQIRVKQVETTNALLLVDRDLFSEGVNTQLDVLQSEYQLSMARQQLIQQQVARREAAVKLATSINLDPEVDLVPHDRLVSKIQLVDPRLTPAELLKIAITNRPELKHFEELRLAAKDQLKVAKSTLLPVISGQGQVLGSGARATSISSGAGTGLSVAGAGVGPAGVSTLPISSASTLGPKEWTARSLFIIGVDAQWNLGGLGVKEVSQINAARADARKASLEFNRSLANVYQQVRDSYLSSLSADNMIIETTNTVEYGAEELRVAEIRLKDGIGTSLDVVNAERDYINALISKANALIQYNVSQVQLLHSIGRMSLDTITSNVPLRQ